MEIFCQGGEQLQRRQPHTNSDGHSYCDRDGHRHSISNGDTTTRNSSYANTAPSADTSASPITL